MWYKAASSDITQVADAIRAKSATTAELEFPDDFVAAIAAIPTGGGQYQSKSQSFTPSTSEQTVTITADSGYDALTSVTVIVTAMTTMTLPTAVSSSGSGTAKATVSRSTSDQYINIPVGWNSAAAYYKVPAVPNGTAGTPTASKGSVSNHSITVTPSVTNSAGYISGGTKTGTAVTVSASELVSGTKTFTANTTSADVTYYKYVTVNIPAINNQDKTVSPSTTAQTVTADTGYSGLGTVTVTAMTAMTLPTATSAAASGTTKATITATSVNQYINIPTGWNGTAANYKINPVTLQSKTATPSGVEQRITADTGYTALDMVTVEAIPAGVATAPALISVSSATVNTAGGLFVLSASTSVTPDITTAGYISSGTAGTSLITMQANIAIRSSSDVAVSGTTVTIPAGYYDQAVTKTVSGSGIGTLINTTSLGALSTTSTSATDTGKSLSIANADNYDLLIVECSVDSVTNNRHKATVSLIFLTGTSNVGTKNTVAVSNNKWNCKVNSSGVSSSRQGTTAYGVYAYSGSLSSGTLTVPIYYRYNSTSSGTINGNYTARVYGVKLYDLIGG